MPAQCEPQDYISQLVPYQPGLPVELVAREHGIDPTDIIKLASNENTLGMSPKAREAIARALPEAHRYPEMYALEQALAAFYEVDSSCVAVANGSTGILDAIARTYLGKGSEAISSQYAFAMYQIFTQMVGATNVVVLAKDFAHDLEAMLAAVTPRTKVIWIANPNNPTGTFAPYKSVKAFLEKVPPQVIVVLDEAYYEFLSPEDAVPSHKWLQEHPNLIVVRTFSKAYGLAGLRVGYALANPAIAELLNRVRNPFSVNALALAGAVAALGDQAFAAKSVRAARQACQQLITGLENLRLVCLPAYGNFVTFKVANAANICAQLLAKGVIIRPLAGYQLEDQLRVSAGSPEENQRFLDTLAEILAPSEQA